MCVRVCVFLCLFVCVHAIRQRSIQKDKALNGAFRRQGVKRERGKKKRRTFIPPPMLCSMCSCFTACSFGLCVLTILCELMIVCVCVCVPSDKIRSAHITTNQHPPECVCSCIRRGDRRQRASSSRRGTHTHTKNGTQTHTQTQ